MSERWLPAVGWEDLYEVSDLGRVRSIRRGKLRTLQATKFGYQYYERIMVTDDGGTVFDRWEIHNQLPAGASA